MNGNDYLGNPVLPAKKTPKDKFYYVKCDDAIERNGEIVAKLIIVPHESYNGAGCTVMYSTLRNSPKSKYMQDYFKWTFRVRGKIEEAIGRIGCVIIDSGEFNGKKFGNVHYHKQSPEALGRSRQYEIMDMEGRIAWK